MSSRDAALFEGELEAKRQTLSFLWYKRMFALFPDSSFRRYDGAELRHSALVAPSTTVSMQGDREFVLSFAQPELRYHMRAESSEQRDRWVKALQSSIQRASASLSPTSVSISNAGSTSPVAAAPAAVPTLAAAAARPAIDFATEWLDELGRVCPKNVDYATQCPKGHALAPFDGSGEPPAQQPSDADVICRVCHGSTQRRHARGWLTCSVAGCCGGYAVCAGCASALVGADVAAAADADFPLEVRGSHAGCC